MPSDSSAIIIPARMESTRFPGKPLAKIAGKPMIEHVVERAIASKMGDVYVAVCEDEVAQVVNHVGAKAIMTDKDLPSGSDRIYQALVRIGKSYDYIVNVQGDLPSIDPQIIKQSLELLKTSNADIATLAAVIHDAREKTDPNVVKAIISGDVAHEKHGRALYFSRATAPYGEGELYHHIGLYAYRASALKQFISLPPSPLEKREKLEQLRALEHGLHIEVGVVDTVPLGVDTPEDVGRIEAILSLF